jgi:23S rRNA (guanine2445-N2)-methyltransferase / 23S rRNA (guanine2069-N7)-methyltransferase
VFLKIRRKQKNTEQYEKQAETGRFYVVEEGGCKFWVNFEDYLDTGLFLDHRPMRLLIHTQAKGKRFLNLFAYTASASVHAAVGGAVSSLTVDMSNTYLDWAKRNFDLNTISGDHKLLRANCLEWLAEQASKPVKLQFDLIFLDPPTFSNSKKMGEAFDIQADHVPLLRHAVSLLADQGILYFSTNFRRFKLDNEALDDLRIENITAATIAEDFARDAKIHYCWRISR